MKFYLMDACNGIRGLKSGLHSFPLLFSSSPPVHVDGDNHHIYKACAFPVVSLGLSQENVVFIYSYCLVN